ncbi:carbohydrate ABC transporter substrate-binding protein, partial [Vibrio splendidus]
MKYVKHIAASAVLAASMSATSFAGTLVINSDASDPAPKEAWGEIINRFEKENPDIMVKYN